MLRTWHGWLFILTALLLAVVMGATLRTAMVMEQSFQWVLHSDEVMARFFELRSTLNEAESNERAYLITGDKAALDTFQVPRRRVEEQLDHLRLMTMDNEPQQQLLQEIELLIKVRFEQLDIVIDKKKAGARSTELAPLVRDGSKLMQLLLQGMDEGLERESDLFDQRETGRRTQLRSMNITTIGSGVLALGTAVVGFVLLRRSQKDALRAAALATQKVKAERSDHMKSRFLANMSHEIRTPMNAILGFTELLAGSTLNERDQRYVKSIQTSGKALLDLINDILDLSRLEAGRMPLSPQPLDLRETVESVRVLLSQTVDSKGIRLHCQTAPEVPETLLLDGLRIRQVLTNLVSNAVKFTSEGGITVEAFGSLVEGDAPFFDLTLRVSDTGVGIAPEDMDRIFSAFEQAAASDAHAAQGTGLGLSITHRLVEMMGGKITVHSTPEQGSIFTITVPRVPVGATPAPKVEDEVCDLNQLQPARILVVDDLASNRDILAAFFEGTHHHLLFAGDGLEAMDQAQKGRPDLILMDIRMPNMDGTWARQLLKDDPATSHIPVIAQTASSMAGESERLKKFFDGYLRKPFSRKKLFTALAMHLPLAETRASPAPVNSHQSPAPSFTAEQTAAWNQLAVDLRASEAGTAARLSETLPMLEIAAFARQLRGLADKHQCEPLRRYVDTLLRAVDAFDLTAVERQLKDFPALLSKLAVRAPLA